jgi:hypothetical protein
MSSDRPNDARVKAAAGGARRWATPVLQVCCALGLLGVMAAIGHRLFSGITTVGMNGVDTFEYWKYAKELTEGRADFTFDRLSFYALNVLAMKTLGVNDYAIRAFIGAAQVANVGLLYLLAARISRNPLVALFAAALYGLNPVIFAYAATELPHVYGATFVLLAGHCAISAVASGARPAVRLIATAGAGFFAADAVLTHEDLLLLAAGLGLALILMVPTGRWFFPQAYRMVAVGAVFTVGFFGGLLWPMLVTRVGPSKLVSDFFAVRAIMDENTLLRTGGLVFRTTAPRVFRNVGELIQQPLFAAALLVVVALPVCQFWRRRKRLTQPLLLETMALSHIVLFACLGRVFLEGGYQRIFIPSVTLIFALTLCGGYEFVRLALSRAAGPRRAAGAATALCVAIAAATLVMYQPQVYAAPAISPHRQLYDAVEGMVTADRKLLLPACFAPAYDFSLQVDWVGIGSEVYLGHDVVSVYLARELKPFDRFVASHSVRYILVTDGYIRGMMSRDGVEQIFSMLYGVPLPAMVRDSMSVAPQHIWPGEMRIIWSPPACSFESEVLRRLVSERKGHVVARVPGIGEVYELPQHPAGQSS